MAAQMRAWDWAGARTSDADGPYCRLLRVPVVPVPLSQAVSVVVSVYWLVAQGPRMVPCLPL